jgi:CRISPR-associated protein Cas2
MTPIKAQGKDMKKKDYLIAYDITEAKRLRKIAKYLEREAFRIQKSLYLLSSVSKKELSVIISNIEKLIDAECDDVRIYGISNTGMALAQAADLNDPYLFTTKDSFKVKNNTKSLFDAYKKDKNDD